MKVLLVGVHFFGSFAWSIGRALERAGCEVEPFDYRRNPFVRLPRVRTVYYQLSMQKNLIRRALSVKPDLILIAKGELVHPTTIEYVKSKLKVPIVNWFPDGRLFSFIQVFDAIPHYNVFFTKNREDLDRSRLLGLKNVRYLPHSADSELHAGPTETIQGPENFHAQISFVGAFYPYRDRILRHLKGYDIRIWGRMWEKSSIKRDKPEAIVGREARGFHQAAVFRGSIINLNTHHFDDISGANQRLFDICGCGGFQLVDHKEVIEEFYDPGMDLDVYSSAEEMIEKVDYYLDHEKETKEMAKRAQRKTMEKHTYDHRIREIFDTIGLGSPSG